MSAWRETGFPGTGPGDEYGDGESAIAQLFWWLVPTFNTGRAVLILVLRLRAQDAFKCISTLRYHYWVSA